MEQTKPIGMAGITTDPWRSKGPLRRRYPDLKNWRDEGPFPDKKAGVAWEKQQAKLGYDTSNGGDDPGRPEVVRYGYQFDY